MKQCIKCLLEKPIEQFRFHSTRKTYYNYCIECHRAQMREHYRANKKYYVDKSRQERRDNAEFIRLAKSVPCMDCKSLYPYYVMDFDHRENKEFNLSGYRNKGRQQIVLEIAKCDIVCSNCHRIRTHERAK